MPILKNFQIILLYFLELLQMTFIIIFINIIYLYLYLLHLIKNLIYEYVNIIIFQMTNLLIKKLLLFV